MKVLDVNYDGFDHSLNKRCGDGSCGGGGCCKGDTKANRCKHTLTDALKKPSIDHGVL
ncbi:unnamed protein product [marine sediment metagenome]|uniref:Uncharacterized protein n=1 Tax=marine sediment metagenome TaxID=412755 RepID=X1I9Q3_9ZZZZ